MESKESNINKALGVEPRWVVADRAIAAWEDEMRDVHFLEDMNAFLLLFHLPLRIRAGSASKPIDLFFVLPVESLESTSPLNATPITITELPEPHIDAIKSAGLDNSTNLLRVQLRLKESGYVLMPRIKVKNELSGTPRNLLLSLQSLSQSRGLTVYLKRNTYSQVALNELSSAVSEGVAHTPAFRFKSLYQGRGAKQGAWELFGLTESDKALKSGNPFIGKGVESEREGSAPPPYEVAVRTPTPSPEDPAQKAATPECREKGPAAPRTPDFVIRDSQSFVEETPPARLIADQPSRKRAFAEAESPSSSDKEIETKRASKSMLQLPLFADDSASIPGSPPLIQRSRSSPPTSNRSLSRRHSFTSGALSSPRNNLNTDELLCEIATWLQDGWVVHPNVHQKLLLPLLALGYYARQRDLRSFDLTKGRCTSQLYIRIATQQTQDSAASECGDTDVEEDMARLIAWANESIFRGVESVLREETAQLGVVAARVCDDGPVAKEEYTRQRALWVASVFVCFSTSRDIEALTERRFNVV